MTVNRGCNRGVRRVWSMAALLMCVVVVVGCSAPSQPQSLGHARGGFTSRFDRSECEAAGLEWAGGQSGCLSPAQIERWKTSGCAEESFTRCKAKGFPEYWEMQKKDRRPTKVLTRWHCQYFPTIDRDWHNDVLCSNGNRERRPYLRGWDSFVTRAEIMQSAQEYEQRLNNE